jgi:acetyl-CoA carboxylase biotin carboxyl carrier protein
MDIRKVKKLIELVETSGIAELEISEGEESVRINRYSAPPQAAAQPAPVPAPSASLPPDTGEGTQETDELQGALLKAPMVGTFYRSPTPEAAPFVEVGQQVQAGQTLAIIEAMKMFNQIEAEKGGTIKKVFVENAEPVEFDQPLFLID